MLKFSIIYNSYFLTWLKGPFRLGIYHGSWKKYLEKYFSLSASASFPILMITLFLVWRRDSWVIIKFHGCHVTWSYQQWSNKASSLKKEQSSLSLKKLDPLCGQILQFKYNIQLPTYMSTYPCIETWLIVFFSSIIYIVHLQHVPSLDKKPDRSPARSVSSFSLKRAKSTVVSRLQFHL